MILESANETSGMNSHRYQELETYSTPQSSPTGQRPVDDWPDQGYLLDDAYGRPPGPDGDTGSDICPGYVTGRTIASGLMLASPRSWEGLPPQFEILA
jgi:hypothetical protein